jgi:hypothetical protein
VVDRRTMPQIESLNVRDGRQCLDGGRGGSITPLLGGRVAPSVRGVAIDVDNRLLEPLRSSVSNLEVRTTDSTTVPVEPASDLVHAWPLLEHMSAHGAALHQWSLRPTPVESC